MRPVIGQSFKPRPPFVTGQPPTGPLLRWQGPWGKYALVLDAVRTQDGRDYFDYGTFDTPGGATFPLVAGFPRCTLLWGSGGVRRSVTFDYPVFGGVFNVSGEEFDVQLTCLSTGTLATANDPRSLPEFRASLASGWSMQARAMTLAQRFVQGFGQAAVSTLVPPFASWLSVSSNTVLPSQAPRIFQLQDSNTGATCYDLRELAGVNTAGVPPIQRIPIITNAQRVQFQGPNAAGSTDIFAMWELGVE
jgi:hypothetical protein